MALKGVEPAPNPQQRGGSKKLEGGSFKFVTPAGQHEGKWLNWQKHIQKCTDESSNIKNKNKLNAQLSATDAVLAPFSYLLEEGEGRDQKKETGNVRDCDQIRVF